MTMHQHAGDVQPEPEQTVLTPETVRAWIEAQPETMTISDQDILERFPPGAGGTTRWLEAFVRQLQERGPYPRDEALRLLDAVVNPPGIP
jgi:hypothetical protein